MAKTHNFDSVDLKKAQKISESQMFFSKFKDKKYISTFMIFNLAVRLLGKRSF